MKLLAIKKSDQSSLILTLCALAVLIGKAIESYLFGSPIKVVLWNEPLLRPLVESFGIAWQSYTHHELMNPFIDGSNLALSLIYLFSAFLILAKKNTQFLKSFHNKALTVTGVILTIHYLLASYSKGQFFVYAIEYSSQMLCVLLYRYSHRVSFRALGTICGLTFIGHGLFASGLLPRPGIFHDMLITVLSISEEASSNVLLAAGIFDLIFGVAVIFLGPRVPRGFLVAAIIWGFLTAAARFVWPFLLGGLIVALQEGASDFLIRSVHFGLPLILLLSQKRAVKV
jgi:hypothetical protein